MDNTTTQQNAQQNNQFFGFNNVGCISGNFTTFMKNFSNVPVYGINVSGNKFTLFPEGMIGGMGMMGMPQGVQTQREGYISARSLVCEMTGVRAASDKSYRLPVVGYPLYVEETNCVLFASPEEREKAVQIYRTGQKLVKAHATGMVALINASYTSAICLNLDKQFFTLSGGMITRLPSPNGEYVEDLKRRFGITAEKLKISNVFVIETVVRNADSDDNDPGTVVSTDVKAVDKSAIIQGEPIIIENSGLVIFEGRDSAEAFVKSYGTVGNYWINKGLKATHDKHEEEIEDINEQVSKDKRSMVDTFMLMGGTSVASILTENVVKSFKQDDDGKATKDAFKALAFGAISIGMIFGMYKAIKWIRDKK